MGGMIQTKEVLSSGPTGCMFKKVVKVLLQLSPVHVNLGTIQRYNFNTKGRDLLFMSDLFLLVNDKKTDKFTYFRSLFY